MHANVFNFIYFFVAQYLAMYTKRTCNHAFNGMELWEFGVSRFSK